MVRQYLQIILLSMLLIFGCSEENKTPNTAASNHTSDNTSSQTPSDGSQDSTGSSDNTTDNPQTPTQQDTANLQAKIDDTNVSIEWEDNDAVHALEEMAKNSVITINMSQYGGFEQVGNLGQSLPTNDSEMTTAPGDIVLYNSDKIVVFYGSNSWSYTRLGKITDQSEEELNALLNKPNVTLSLY